MPAGVSPGNYPVPLVSPREVWQYYRRVGTVARSRHEGSGRQMTQQSVQYVAQGTEGGGAALDQVIGMSVVGLRRRRRAAVDRLPAPHAQDHLAARPRRARRAHVQAARVGGAAHRPCSSRRSSPRCSASSGTSACTSATAATRARWPTPRTTSSCSGSSCCSSRGMLACVLPLREARARRGPHHPRLVRARSAAS